MTHTTNTNTTATTRYPFMTAPTSTSPIAHTGKDYDEALFHVRYDNSFIDDLWMHGVEGDLGDKECASLYSLEDAKAFALESVNMDPAFDSNGLVIGALTGEVVFDGADYLSGLIAREAYHAQEKGLPELEQQYEWVFSYSELMELNEKVDLSVSAMEAFEFSKTIPAEDPTEQLLAFEQSELMGEYYFQFYF